jgi:hypothetical protein
MKYCLLYEEQKTTASLSRKSVFFKKKSYTSHFIRAKTFSTAEKPFPVSGFDLCFLTRGTSFLSTDDQSVSAFLHVPSASEVHE